MRFQLRGIFTLAAAAVALGGCRTVPTTVPPATIPPATGARSVAFPSARRQLMDLADDSMQGRRTGTPGARRAAKYIAEQMAKLGLEPAGDSGYFQRVPLSVQTLANGTTRLAVLPSWAAFDSLPPERRVVDANVVGILRGSDPILRDSVVLVDAHYDHLGIGRPVAGDSIFNGADDDASGAVTVLQVARAMTAGARPKRTVIFLTTTGEELGLLGTRWYVAHPVIPLTSVVANLEIEMVGRPDSLAGGAGRAWLTGYERSTMGPTFTAAGLPVVADPRPTQHFFERSDNIAFAQAGIPAHTLSTFNLHQDYHRLSDDVSKFDFEHFDKVIGIATRAVEILANGAAPHWNPGGQPAPAAPRR